MENQSPVQQILTHISQIPVVAKVVNGVKVFARAFYAQCCKSHKKS